VKVSIGMFFRYIALRKYLISNTLIMPLKNDYDYSQDELDNHANILNSNNDKYWDSRDEDNPNN
jgi:hypothetical protein